MDALTVRRDKDRVTLVSVAAAVGLVGIKLSVGLLTGSLGLLSEAAHSGLDLVASIITFFSVRIAGRPADANHPYGHGRVENLAAIVQGLLLLTTAGAILYEACRRLFFIHVPVEASGWAFAVMGTSIVIDYWRSQMLTRAARRHHSRAMEADALNFRADMFSSAVVIVGLALTAYGERTGRDETFARADAAAAIVVAVVIVAMSGRLAAQGIGILLDQAPPRLRARLWEAAESAPGVLAVEAVRLRESGDRLFADVTVAVPRTMSLAEAHASSERIEEALRGVEPRLEAVVHVEPAPSSAETAADRVRAIALGFNARTHDEQVHRVGDHLEASLHLEVAPDLPLRDAHDQARRIGTALRDDNPSLLRVNTHIEVEAPKAEFRREVTDQEADLVDTVRAVAAEAGHGAQCHEIRLYRFDEPGLDAALHCDFPPSLPMIEVHKRTELIEQALRLQFPELGHLVIHAEPAEEQGSPLSVVTTSSHPRPT